MKQKFFFKNLMLVLLPVLTSVIILGTLSILIAQQKLEDELNRASDKQFTQMESTLDLVFNEMEFLSLGLGQSNVLYQLEKILQTQTLTLDQYVLIEYLKNTISAPAHARPYVESVYVYVNNRHNQFLSSDNGLSHFRSYRDTDWYDSYMRHLDHQGIRTEKRALQRYSFEKPTPVITLYQNLYASVSSKPIGVIVLNLYADFIQQQLQNAAMYPGQLVAVFNEQKDLMFASTQTDTPDLTDWGIAGNHEPGGLRFVDDSSGYLRAQMWSDRYRVHYVTATPKAAIQQIPGSLGAVTLMVVAISFILSLLLTVYITRRNVGHIRRIVSIIQAAEHDQPLPKPNEHGKEDEYGYIIQNIVQHFIEQKYLQVQLNEKKYHLQAAELLALQAQMNPHFLFNTLETINWRAIRLTQGPNDVNRMIEDLSDLLRYSLEGNSRIVPLQKEIQHTNNYIRIQKVRYADRFDFYWEYEESVYRHGIIKLLLQPLIENSLYHGLKEKPGKGRIKVKLLESSNDLQIAVIDNGVGMTRLKLHALQQQLLNSQEPDGHVGLYNTNKRLQLTYGNDCCLVIRSKVGWGTSVTIRLPI